jgi:hypothetical protein
MPTRRSHPVFEFRDGKWVIDFALEQESKEFNQLHHVVASAYTEAKKETSGIDGINLSKELADWITASAQGRVWVSSKCFAFENEEDAVLFQMTWGA